MRPIRASHSASSTALCRCDCLLPCAHQRMQAMLHRPTAIGTATAQQKQHQISAPSCQASAPGAHAVQGRKPAPTFVEVFRGAAQYVKSHRNQTMVICLPSEVNFLGIAVRTRHGSLVRLSCAVGRKGRVLRVCASSALVCWISLPTARKVATEGSLPRIQMSSEHPQDGDSWRALRYAGDDGQEAAEVRLIGSGAPAQRAPALCCATHAPCHLHHSQS